MKKRWLQAVDGDSVLRVGLLKREGAVRAFQYFEGTVVTGFEGVFSGVVPNPDVCRGVKVFW